MQHEPSSLALDAAKGALAGALAVWAMDRVTWFMYHRQDRAALRRELETRPDYLDVSHNLAREGAHAAGEDIPAVQPHPAGLGTHYALGIVPGMLYAMLRKRVPVLGDKGGALYGMSIFTLWDEVASRALGLASGPRAYPWQSHARGVVGHLVLGTVTEALLKGSDRLAQKARH